MEIGLFISVSSAVAFAAPNASWSFVDEPFAYADGPLAHGSGSPWKRFESAPPIKIEAQTAVLGPGVGKDGYITRKFSSLGLDSAPNPSVEARCTLSLSSPNGALERGGVGTVLLFTGGDGKARRGRLMFRIMADGTFQLGVTSKTSSGVAWAPNVFNAGTDYRVVLVYESAKGRTRLWIETDQGSSLGSPIAESLNADTVVPMRVGLQVDAEMGANYLKLDDLLVQPYGELK